ncbi:hypothetical protein [Patulibacter sp.]|uniref:hypothetical protein n=1 Tax=Patulibacter sp. TaxID=1912859 RepID=UPI00271670E6|nr:hypothetical protein [Patulibacter sp.]MDO9409714.1 hypothetical protein [Patulibacter sp.]
MADEPKKSGADSILARIREGRARYEAMTPEERAESDARSRERTDRQLAELQAQNEATRLRQIRNEPFMRMQADQEDRMRDLQRSNAEMAETMAKRRAEGVGREEAMIERLGVLAEAATHERAEAQERERVAERRHTEALAIARSGVFWARVAGILAAVAIIATVAVAV